MKALVIEEPNRVCIKDVPVPTPVYDEVLIRVAAAGFCGSDVHIFKGEHVASYPVIPGHEFSGTVVACGNAVRNFQPGDRVTADPNIFCENCDACKSNHQIHCEHLRVLGSLRDGAFAEYVTVPERCVFHIGAMDFLQASMCEPLGCVINSHNKFEMPIGGRVLIMGAGTIGLMQLLVSARRGASQIVMTDVKPGQLEIAKKLGASKVILADGTEEQALHTAAPDGFDVVIDATGVPACVEMGVKMLKYAGKLIVFGACPAHSSIRLNPFEVFFRDLQIIGSYALEKTMAQSIAMIENGGLVLTPLIGRTVSINDAVEVFNDFAQGRTSNKIILCFDDIN